MPVPEEILSPGSDFMTLMIYRLLQNDSILKARLKNIISNPDTIEIIKNDPEKIAFKKNAVELVATFKTITGADD